jgi:hypothetical protein
MAITSTLASPYQYDTNKVGVQGFNMIAPPQAGMTLTGQGQAQGSSGSPDLGIGDIGKAGEGAELLKSRYIDANPYQQYLDAARTGTLAMLGRQSEIDRSQLEAGLRRMGQGVNALRRTGARAGLNTELAYRYMGAEKGLGELGMATADRAMGAINDYIGAYLNMAGRRQGAYSAYWNRYSQNQGPRVTVGARSTADLNAQIDARQRAQGIRNVAEQNVGRQINTLGGGLSPTGNL